MPTSNYYSPFLPEHEDYYEEWESEYSSCEALEYALILAIKNGDLNLIDHDGEITAVPTNN